MRERAVGELLMSQIVEGCCGSRAPGPRSLGTLPGSAGTHLGLGGLGGLGVSGYRICDDLVRPRASNYKL